MALPLTEMPDQLLKRRTVVLWDDFLSYTDTQLWTKTAGTGCAAAAAASDLNGLLKLTTGSTANAECFVQSTNALFKFVSGRAWIAECRLNFAEANTNKAQVLFGFSSVGAGIISTASGNGTINSSFSGAVIYKNTGSNVWKCATSVGSTQSLSTSTATAGAGGTSAPNGVTGDQVLRIEANADQASNVQVSFFLNDVHLLDVAQTRIATPIKHQVAFSGAALMNLIMYVQGDSTSGETLNVDYACGLALR